MLNNPYELQLVWLYPYNIQRNRLGKKLAIEISLKRYQSIATTTRDAWS